VDLQPPPTVSVALCTYNGERYVAQQVRSILEQTRPVDQLVVSDDGSRDTTVAVVEAVIEQVRAEEPARTPVVVMLRAVQPAGVVGNFERALEACTGDLIALSDQDDVWHADRIDRMLAALDRAPDVTLLHGDARLIDAEGSALGVTLFEALGVSAAERAEIAAGREFDSLLRRNLVTGATTLLRRSVRDAALPVPEGWIHDEWLAIVAAATGRTALVEQVVTDYRQHGANQIGARRPTPADLVSRLREPRTDRNARLLQRAASLAERIGLLDGVDPADVAAAGEKLEHERRRSALPARRSARLRPVLAAARRGDYARFGNGPRDVLRDLLQPE
jgi:glycosyltransferase involved in cell wall biosynthesis